MKTDFKIIINFYLNNHKICTHLNFLKKPYDLYQFFALIIMLTYYKYTCEKIYDSKLQSVAIKII